MRKYVFLILMLVFTGITACGVSRTRNGDKREETGNLTIQGEIEEIDDYMFVLEVGDDRSYAFPVENGYLEMRGIGEDDWVTVTYTGELSEVRAFNGELVSVEKIR